MQLIITVPDGATGSEIAQALRSQAESLTIESGSKSRKNTASPVSSKASAAPSDEETDDTDFVTETAAGANGFDDDDAEEVKEEPKKATAAKGKTTKPKKITLDDVNDACKAHAQAKGRPATLDVLQKRFKTQSVTALKPEQYEACISAMAVN